MNFLSQASKVISRTGSYYLLLFVFVSIFIFSQLAQATVYQPGETLEPDCAPGSANCGVAVFANLNSTSTDALAEGIVNLYFTNARARSAISSSVTGLTYAAGTGIFSLTSGYTIPLSASSTEWDSAYANRITSASSPLSISGNVLSLAQASSTASGYLSSTDWSTFNNKLGTSLTDGRIIIGNGSNTTAAVVISGDAALANTGVLTIQSDAVALGADTTGNYVATLADAGSGRLTITGSGSETAGLTIDIANNAVDGTKIALGSDTNGDIMYYNGTDWVRLAAGTSGQLLQTNGVAAPSWVSDITSSGNFGVNGGTLSTSATTAALFNTNATELNIGGSATTIGLGAAGATVSGAGAFTLKSGSATALTIDSGTTGAVNIGTDNVQKTITVGNSTGATQMNLTAGTGGIFLTGLAAQTSGNLVVCINNTTKKLYVGNSATSCNVSSLRYKHNVAGLTLGLAAVNALHPVSYTYNSNDENTFGFIAEEAGMVDERLINRNTDGVIEGINPDAFTPILTQAIQEVSVLIGDVSSDSDADIATIQSENAKDPAIVFGIKKDHGVHFLTDFVAARVTAFRGYFERIDAKKVCLTKADGVSVCLTSDQLELLLNSKGVGNAVPVNVVPVPAPDEVQHDEVLPIPAEVPLVVLPVEEQPPADVDIVPEPAPVAVEVPAPPAPPDAIPPQP